MRRILAAEGYNEAINFSFIDAAHDDQIEPIPELIAAGGERFVTLRNPIIDESVRMRPSLIPGLLNSSGTTSITARKTFVLFEIGRVFAGLDAENYP